uniref:Putative secreted protein n=1 Tax=Anopheles triannulatus TaxID=58253 RepID=A0A2M4B2Q8_9DIPT
MFSFNSASTEVAAAAATTAAAAVAAAVVEPVVSIVASGVIVTVERFWVSAASILSVPDPSAGAGDEDVPAISQRPEFGYVSCSCCLLLRLPPGAVLALPTGTLKAMILGTISLSLPSESASKPALDSFFILTHSSLVNV